MTFDVSVSFANKYPGARRDAEVFAKIKINHSNPLHPGQGRNMLVVINIVTMLNAKGCVGDTKQVTEIAMM